MKQKKRKILSILLVTVMLFTMMPTSALAETDSYGVDKEWYNFRNNPENNGITVSSTPTEATEAVQKWAVKYGSGWSAAPTPPLILDGKLYIGVANQIIELDKETGEELRRSDEMIGNVGYAMNPITYADGKLFVQVGNGCIQAVDFKSLKCLWYSEQIGGQTLCPISYANIDGQGYIYSGTWANETRDGYYFCVSTDDENTSDVEGATKGGGKVKSLTWKFTPSTDDKALSEGTNAKRGFYWAGAYATDKYIAVGSDDGASGYTSETATFYTLDSKTGQVIDRIENIKGDIRSTTVYDNGYIYFSTKGGIVYKAAVSEEGNISDVSYIDIGAVTGESVMATAAPVVYGNKIYMGVSGSGGQFDPDAGHGFRVIDNSGSLSQDSILYNIPIPGYPQAAALASTAYVNEDYDNDGKADGRVYLYFTYNARPGGIYYCYDTADQRESKEGQSGELFVPAEAQQQYCISTICSDNEGTLYYKNDSCYLMAVEKNPAYIDDITVVGGNNEAISWNQGFSASLMEYTLKIPASMETAEISIEANADMKVTIDGKVYDGKTEITLPQGDKTVQIVVTKEEKEKTYSRTYSLNFVRAKSISTLESLKVGTSNSFRDFVTLTPEFSSENLKYDADTTESDTSFWRVWLKKTDENSTITVTPVENVEKITESSGTPATQGHDRWNVYKTDKSKSASIRIDVTSEDGEKTTTYNLRLLVPVKATGVTLDKDNAVIDVTEQLQLNATVHPEDATNKDVTWYSSDTETAEVSQDGVVTPKKAGQVTVTVIADDGSSLTDSCTVTIEDAAAEVDKKINGIGTVTLESKADIDVARAAYEALNDKQKERVTALDKLEAAEGAYNKLKEEADKEEADKAAAAAVDAKINAIGEEITLESKSKIEEARAAYDALTQDQKEKVTALDKLEAAEDTYSKLKEEADKAAAAAVDAKITAIGEEITLESKSKIEEARAAYDALTQDQKEKVTALDKLKAAEDTYNKLKEEADKEEADKAAATAVDAKINAIGEEITLESKSKIEEARAAYDALTQDQKEKVTALDKLKAAEDAYNLLVSKAEAKNELLNYKDMNSYRQAQQNEIKALIDNASMKIDAAESIEDVNNIVTEIKASLNKIKTDDQLTKEENQSKEQESQMNNEESNAVADNSLNQTPKTDDGMNILNWIVVAILAAVCTLGLKSCKKSNK